MIYFIVNNNYHFLDFKTHLLSVDANAVTLIGIPHTLNPFHNLKVAAAFWYSRSSRPGFAIQLRDFVLLARRIDRDILPAKEDVLFFYTEYELLNQYLAGRFKQAGARVYLIEDGGLGTYVPFRLLAGETLTVKEWVKQWIYRSLPGLPRTRLHKLNGHIFHWMLDSSIDGVCLYRPVALRRNIPSILIRRPAQPKLALLPDRAIFLNEPIYDDYQSGDSYLEGLDVLIRGLCARYSNLLFKFHPRETDEWRARIEEQVLKRFPSVKVIRKNSAIEAMVDELRPSVVASYFCSALLSLSDRGIEPLYLYHLIPEISGQPIFQETTLVLGELGYVFIPSLSAIPNDYRSGLSGISSHSDALELSRVISQQ